jgi:pantetheine-phosphate adenylyltransferase
MSTPRYRRGLVPISADPITSGHLDLIARGAADSGELIVAIMNNDLKKGAYLFSLEERLAMAERAIFDADIRNVRVITDAGLLTDLYMREDCDAVFRGVRDETDRLFEERQASVHASIHPPISGHFVFLTAKPELDKISSSLVKAFVLHHLDISGLVPAFVKRRLEECLVRQIKVAVTGGIAVGKSSVAKGLAERFSAKTGLKAWHIDVDQLVRDLYVELTPGAQAMRETLAELFGGDVLTADRKGVDRAVLAERIFSPGCDPQLREKTQALTEPHVDRKFREALAGKDGLIVIEWAQLAEMALGRWANHRVIVVDSPDRARFAELRKIPADRLKAIRESQWPADKKVKRLLAAATKANEGQILRYTNHLREEEAERLNDLDGLAAEVASLFPEFIAKEVQGAHRTV